MSEEDERKKPFPLSERLFQFASRILDICAMLPSTPEAMNIRYQMGRSGPSSAANWEEAEGAISKKDKRKSMVTSRKEVRETRLFLRLSSGRFLPEDEIAPDIEEAGQLINILSTIINKLS